MIKLKNFIVGIFNLYILFGLVICNFKWVVLFIWVVGINLFKIRFRI